MLGEPLEVLDGSGEEEYLAGAGEAPQSEPDHRENVLSLAEEGFDPPALDTGHPIGLGVHQALGIVAGFLMDVTLDPSLPAGGDQRTDPGDLRKAAAQLTCAMPGKDPPVRFQDLPLHQGQLIAQGQQAVSCLRQHALILIVIDHL